MRGDFFERSGSVAVQVEGISRRVISVTRMGNGLEAAYSVGLGIIKNE